MIFQITIAEKVIEIHTVYDFSYYYCLEYVTNKPRADFVIQSSIKEINDEINTQGIIVYRENYKKAQYYYGYAEFLALLRKISGKMLEFSTILMHGVVVSDGRYGYILSAPSGTGKTTRALYLKNQLQDVDIINGDKPFIKVETGKVTAFGTPWCGKEYMEKNCSVPLRAIFLLERAEKTEIKKMTVEEALPKLIGQTYFAPLMGSYKKTMELLYQFGKSVNIYRYCSTSNIDDILIAYDIASKQ